MSVGEVFSKPEMETIESIAPGCTVDEVVDALPGTERRALEKE